MEAVGFGLAVLSEVRSLLASIKARIQSVRQSPANFRILSKDLDRLTLHIQEVERLLQGSPSAIPAEISALFNETFASVRDSLGASNTAMQQVLVPAFSGSTNGVRSKIRSLLKRTARASALTDEMSGVQIQIRDASGQLMQLISVLSTALKIQETQGALLGKMNDLQIAGTVEGVYRRAITAPALSHNSDLNFDARDAEGQLTTLEGVLKHTVLSSASCALFSRSAGVMHPVFGVVGMAGVGKTVALQGLAHDKDIRSRFPDGILYITLGEGASSQTVIGEICKALTITGATGIVRTVENCSSLPEAIDYAVTWFIGRVCLFVVDNMWPIERCRTGFLNDVRQLLRSCPESRMVVSTRSLAIAHMAGSIVEFGVRDPLGHVSQRIFMSYATGSVRREDSRERGCELRSSVSKILSMCGGLPIALAITGCAVALLARTLGSLDRACDIYSFDHEKKRASLGEEENPEGSCLNAEIFLSLNYLETELLTWKTKNALDLHFTMRDLFTSFCVLKSQTCAPVSVLARMWKLDPDVATEVVNMFCGMSLAKLCFQKQKSGSEKACLILHDLHLGFCQRESRKKKTLALWHARLLDGYLDERSITNMFSNNFEEGTMVSQYGTRPWWCEAVSDDGYIHENIGRHLSQANKSNELLSLLLDARWTHLRVDKGGITALEEDFASLGGVPNNADVLSKDIKQTIDCILKTLQLSWGRALDGKRSLFFQVCGRLHSLRKENAIVDAFVQSMKIHTPKPYLMPVSPFFPDVNNALVMEIPLGGRCAAVCCSPCGGYIAVEAGHAITVADATTGHILQRLAGHTGPVSCITFAEGSKKLVSGSHDYTVIVWEWESSDQPRQVLQGHKHRVSGVAVSSEGGRIFSGAWDHTLRIWNAATGSLLCEFGQDTIVTCLALSADDRKVALGLGDGTVSVLDSLTGERVFQDSSAHVEIVTSVAFCPNGAYLATGSWDKTVRLYNCESWNDAYGPLHGHDRMVSCVAFSQDGRQLATGSKDGTVRLWSIATGQTVGVSPKVHSWVRSVAFILRGTRILSGFVDGTVRIWDVPLGSDSADRPWRHSEAVSSISISHDGGRVASGSWDGTIGVWDLQIGSQIGVPLQGHKGGVRCITFSPDGQMIASGSYDKSVRIWDAEFFAQIGDPLYGHTECVSTVSFAKDGLHIISGSFDKTVRIWSAHRHEQIGDPVLWHIEHVFCASESIDGLYVVSRDWNSNTIILNQDRSIVWTSNEHVDKTENQISEEEAKRIIVSCGQDAPFLWPKSFPAFSLKVICEDDSVYAKELGGYALLGTMPSHCVTWRYDELRKVFVAGLLNGDVAICTFVGISE